VRERERERVRERERETERAAGREREEDTDSVTNLCSLSVNAPSMMLLKIPSRSSCPTIDIFATVKGSPRPSVMNFSLPPTGENVDTVMLASGTSA
jgi:hypothetical protein